MRCVTLSAITAIVLTCATGCGTPQLALSDSLAPHATSYPVSGRTGILVKQRMSFGPFQTVSVKRSWIKGPVWRTGIGTGGSSPQDWVNIISKEYIRRRQTLNFSLTDGTNTTDAYCVSRFNADDLQVGANRNSILNIGLDLWGKGLRMENLFYVQIFRDGEDRPWQLVLDNHRSQSDTRRYEGMLVKNRDEFYTITPATRIVVNGRAGAMPFGAAGFEIHNNKGVAVAAVSLMEKGMVYLGTVPAAEKLLLATLCAALLLQEQIG